MKLNLNRRTFLSTTLIALSSLSYFSMSKKFHKIKGKYLVFGYQENGIGFLGRFDLEQKKFKKLLIDPAKKIHDIFPSSYESNIFFGADKNGNSLIEFDVEKLVEVNRISLKNDRFYGHGVFAEDNRHLWLTAYAPGYSGLLKKFDTLKKVFVSEVKTGGFYPHQVQVLPENRFIFGQVQDLKLIRSQLCIIDGSQNKIDKTHTFSQHSIGTVDHFCVVDSKTVIAPLTREVKLERGEKKYLPAPVYVWNIGSERGHFVELPNSQKEESLTDTVIHFKDNFALITNSARKELMMFNLKTHKFEDRIYFKDSPLGISLDNERIAVNLDSMKIIYLKLSEGKLKFESADDIIKIDSNLKYQFEAHSFIV